MLVPLVLGLAQRTGVWAKKMGRAWRLLAPLLPALVEQSSTTDPRASWAAPWSSDPLCLSHLPVLLQVLLRELDSQLVPLSMMTPFWHW
jgi:hypothetical protein